MLAAKPERQQILGEQDALHVILVFVDHREAGVAGFDDDRQELVHRLGLLDGHHLGAGIMMSRTRSSAISSTPSIMSLVS